jgi:hypothetical protein
MRVELVGQVRVELPAAPLPHERSGGADSPDAMGNLGELSDGGQPGRDRHVLPCERSRPTLAVPLLVGGIERSQGVVRKVEFLPQLARHHRVMRDHAAQVAMAGHRELQADAEPVDHVVVGARSETP